MSTQISYFFWNRQVSVVGVMCSEEVIISDNQRTPNGVGQMDQAFPILRVLVPLVSLMSDSAFDLPKLSRARLNKFRIRGWGVHIY